MSHRIAIMQPYLFPYIGYFQLMGCVDRFVVYDRIKYTKKGWINRNRLLGVDGGVYFSLPLKAASDSLDVVDRVVSDDFDPKSLINRFDAVYRRAPYYAETMELIRSVMLCKDRNLFGFLLEALLQTISHLKMDCSPLRSSEVERQSDELKGQDRVLNICKMLRATHYINPIGGVGLYGANAFESQGVGLYFLRSNLSAYPQFKLPFVPALSILDVLFFNGCEETLKMISEDYVLMSPSDASVGLSGGT